MAGGGERRGEGEDQREGAPPFYGGIELSISSPPSLTLPLAGGEGISKGAPPLGVGRDLHKRSMR